MRHRGRSQQSIGLRFTVRDPDGNLIDISHEARGDHMALPSLPL